MKQIVELIELEEQHKQAVSEAREKSDMEVSSSRKKMQQEIAAIEGKIQTKDSTIADAVAKGTQKVQKEVTATEVSGSFDVAKIEKVILEHLD